MGTYKNMQKWCKDKKRLNHASKYNEIELDGDN